MSTKLKMIFLFDRSNGFVMNLKNQSTVNKLPKLSMNRVLGYL